MRVRVLGAILAGLLACGLPLWPIPYREVSMPDHPAASDWFLLGALAGLLAGHLLRQRIWVPILAVTAGFGLAVLGRVAVETTRDPTSHNLWPIEVIIAGGIGLAAAAVGVGMARVVQRAAARR